MLLSVSKDYANDLAKVVKNNAHQIFGDEVDVATENTEATTSNESEVSE